MFASNQIGKKLGYGFSGDRTVCDLPERIKNRFSLDLDGLVASLPDLDEEVEKAKVFIRLGEAAQ
ncbi:MAG: hypothetical protein PHV85_04130 [Desulfovibrionaceae bacterium]|nr:hypothetical protein [Desulfovibrionaceae bacterium]